MDIKLVGNAVVITSVPAASLKKVAKYAPKATRLYDEDKNEVFGVFTGKSSISKLGVSFGEESKEGLAQATIQLPEDTKAGARKAYVQENFGVALYNLSLVEIQINSAITGIDSQLNTVEQAIKEVE